MYDAIVAGYEKISKDDFLGVISQIRQKTFKPSTIKLGFRLTSLWPINPAIVCDTLEDLERDFSYNTLSLPLSVSQGLLDISTLKTT